MIVIMFTKLFKVFLLGYQKHLLRSFFVKKVYSAKSDGPRRSGAMSAPARSTGRVNIFASNELKILLSRLQQKSLNNFYN